MASMDADQHFENAVPLVFARHVAAKSALASTQDLQGKALRIHRRCKASVDEATPC
jgi:hypothetical protein